MQGLSVDPTVDSSDDDFKEAPFPDTVLAHFDVGECGVRSSVSMTAADATHMLQISRSSGKELTSTDSASPAEVSPADFPFIKVPLLCDVVICV